DGHDLAIGEHEIGRCLGRAGALIARVGRDAREGGHRESEPEDAVSHPEIIGPGTEEARTARRREQRYAGNRRSKLPPRIAARSAALTRRSSRMRHCWSYTFFCQPRGKKDESDPNRIRDAPATAIALRKTSVSVRPGENFS